MRVFFGILQSLWDQNTRMDWNFRREIRVRAEIIQIFAHFFQKCVKNFFTRMDFPTVNGTHIRNGTKRKGGCTDGMEPNARVGVRTMWVRFYTCFYRRLSLARPI